MRKLDQSNKGSKKKQKKKKKKENVSQDNMTIFKYISNTKCE